MLNFIIGFILGYYVANNQEEVKCHWNKIVEWVKLKYNYIKNSDTENKI
jgi:hypothetical protein